MPEFVSSAVDTALSVGEKIVDTVVDNAGAIGQFAVRTALTIGVSKLVADRADEPAAGTQDSGARIQLPPSTDNKLPVIYGTGYVSPNVIDAFISTDQTTMWYVLALSETTDTGTFSFGNIYYNNQICLFSEFGDPTRVAGLRSNSTPFQDDTKIDGNMFVYLYTDGSFSGYNTLLSAIEVLSDPAIPEASRWTTTDTMTDTVFMIVKLIYNQDAGTTSLGQITAQVENSNYVPGSVILDYMTNSRYGCALPLDKIDTASLTALDTYSNELIEYYDANGDLQEQARYRINGPINTGNNCLANLQQLADACDSWLQYSELTGKWKVVINRSYEQAGQTINDLYLVDSSVLFGGININPLDLNGTYNRVEVQYPNANIRDQTEYKLILLEDYLPGLMSPNEPDNQLVIQYQIVNNYVQALYLGVRRMLQSREDLVIDFNLDYSGIQVEAGDVLRVTLEEYGWENKLFRASQVQEAKQSDGSLGVRITAFEYNSTIYDDTPLQDFVPENNTGLSNPNIFSLPGMPVVQTNALTDGNVASFNVESTVPLEGNTLYMDFNYGDSNDPTTHKLYSSTSKGDGSAYTPGETVSINVTDLGPNTYYWSITARNNSSGSQPSSSSLSYSWAGPNVTAYNPDVGAGGIDIAQMAPGAAGFLAYSIYNMGVASSIPPPTVTASSTINQPYIYPGTTVASGYYDTWRSGTWPYSWLTTPTGLGPYVPFSARGPSGTRTELATLGWYLAIFIDLTSDPLTTDERIQLSGTLSITTDTNNTRIQIVRAPNYSGGIYVFNLASLQDAIIPNATESTTGVVISDVATGASTILGYSYFIRNVTPGSNITIVQANLAAKQTK